MNLPVARKKLGRENPKLKINWILENKFPNSKSAIDHLSAEEIWSVERRPKYSSSDNFRVYYRCNRLEARRRCTVIKYLQLSNNSDEVCLYKLNINHSHDKTNKKYHISNAESCQMEVTQMKSDCLEVKHNENLTQNPKAQNKFNKWTFEKIFDGIEDAKNYIKQQQIWSFNYSNRTAVGFSYYYRCNMVPKIGPQCAAQKYFWINRKNSKVTMYQSDYPHTHNDIKKPMNATICDVRKKSDSLLDCLQKTDRDSILKRGYRTLDAVVLRNCPVSPIGSVTSLPIDNNEIKTKKICKRKDTTAHFTSDWIFEKKFPKEEMALEYLAKEATWMTDNTIKLHVLDGGHKIYYRCNKIKGNGPKCAARKCLFYFADSDDVSVYRKNSKHTHKEIEFHYKKKQEEKLVKTTQKSAFKSARNGISKNKSIKQTDSNLDISNNSQSVSMELVTGDDSTQYIINYIDNDQSSEGNQQECDSDWVYQRSFATTENAMEFLDENNWLKTKSSTLRFQTKIYYRCYMFKNPGSPCNAQIYILRCTETNRILVFRNLTLHSHVSNENWNTPLPKIQRTETERTVISLQSENINEIITPDEFTEFNDKYSETDKISITDILFESCIFPPTDSLLNSNFILKEESDTTTHINQLVENRTTVRSSLSVGTNSDTADDSDTTQLISKPKKVQNYTFDAEKRFNFNKGQYLFTLKQTFSNLTEAKKQMKEDSAHWISLCVKQFDTGYRHFFRCNHSNTFEKCSCRVLLLVRNNTDEVRYYTSSPHVHA